MAPPPGAAARAWAAGLLLLWPAAAGAAAAGAQLDPAARRAYAAQPGLAQQWPVEFAVRALEPLVHHLAASARHGGASIEPTALMPEAAYRWGRPEAGVAGALGTEVRAWRTEGGRHRGREELMATWRNYLHEWHLLEHAELKILDALPGPGNRVVLQVALAVGGRDRDGMARDDEGILELQAGWVGGAWRLRSLLLQRLQSTLRPRKLFVDVSEGWLSGIGDEAFGRLRLSSRSDALAAAAHGGSGDQAPSRLSPLALEARPGAAVVDVDDDGWDDLLVWDVEGPATLLRNDHGRTFRDVTALYGLQLSEVSAAAFADLDNDGVTDLVVGHWLRAAEIFFGGRDAAGRLTFLPAAASLPAQVAAIAVADVDRDGRLDIFFATADASEHGPRLAADPNAAAHGDANVDQLGPPNVLLVGDGNQRFHDGTEAAGLTLMRSTVAVAFGDYDGDGWADLALANQAAPATAYHNARGTFIDVSEALGADRVVGSAGVSFGDVDGDGHDDLLLSGSRSAAASRIMGVEHNFAADLTAAGRSRRRQANRGLVLLGPTLMGLADVAAGVPPTGVHAVDAHAMGAQLVDLDGDGWLDVWAPTGLYTNPAPPEGPPRQLDSDIWRAIVRDSPRGSGAGVPPVLAPTWSVAGHQRDLVLGSQAGRRLVDVSHAAGLDAATDGRAGVWADFDRDGSLDLALVARNAPLLTLLRGDPAAPAPHVALRLTGDGTASNAQAVGARVTLTCGGRHVSRVVAVGGGAAAQSSRVLTVGVGACAERAGLDVIWPSGRRDAFAGVALRQAYDLLEGESVLRPLP